MTDVMAVLHTKTEEIELEEALPDEPAGDRPRCACGRFSELISPPETNVFGDVVYVVECSTHGRVAVS